VTETAEKIEAVKLGASEHVEVEALGVTVSRGYLFWVRPDSEEARSGEPIMDATTGETWDNPDGWGFYGNDSPPCQGRWVADEDLSSASSGYLVISDLETIETVDGWTAEAADLDDGWFYSDNSGWHVVVLRRHGREHEYTICGSVMP
jgi:hypothetical protein